MMVGLRSFLIQQKEMTEAILLRMELSCITSLSISDKGKYLELNVVSIKNILLKVLGGLKVNIRTLNNGLKRSLRGALQKSESACLTGLEK